MKHKREDKELRRAIEELPQFSPSHDLWDAIEESLQPVAKSKGKRMLWIKVAAAVTFLIGFFLILSKSQSQQEALSYSEEIALVPVSATRDFLKDQEFVELLDTECESTNEVCEEEEFKGLLAQLEAVQDEVKQLVLMIDESGMDHYLLKAKGRLEKEDAEIKKRIVAYLRD